MILIKRGAVIANLQDERILEPAYIADRIWKQFGWGDVRITAGIDGNHAAASYHYGAGQKRGQGIDLGLASFYSGDRAIDSIALAELQKACPTWRIVMEKDHYHCQKEKP